jgi:hypothetical protein
MTTVYLDHEGRRQKEFLSDLMTESNRGWIKALITPIMNKGGNVL